VAVGYPGGVSVAFDAARCRLTYAWSGSFLDASPVWNDRGGNPVGVLGRRFWTAPPGCPWATTNNSEPPDFAARASDPAYGADLPEGEVYQGPRSLHFDGYTVDRGGMPTFRYRVENGDGGGSVLEVSERPEPLLNPIADGVTRRFTLRIPAQATPWFFAGQTNRDPRVVEARKGMPLPLDLKSAKVEMPFSGRLLILPQDGDRVAVLELADASEGTAWVLRRHQQTWQALVRLPVSFSSAGRHLVLRLWVLPRDEPGLVKELHSRK
jgi:hypothetical protein